MFEEEFIINASRLNFTEDNIKTLRIISNEIDWSAFEKKACIHGVEMFIYYSLKNSNLFDLVPADVFKRFQESYYQNALRNLMFIEEIKRLSEIIPYKIVLLKGADLIQTLYPNIAIRFMGDIDILLEKDKIVDSWNAMQSNGFVLSDQPEPLVHKPLVHKSLVHRKLTIKNKNKHLPPLNRQKCNVEIHWNLFNRIEDYNVTCKALQKTISLNSSKHIHTLSIEFLIIHLCSHFCAHGNHFIPLRMLCDINELILKHSKTINWNEIKKICINTELKNEVTISLTYTYIFFKTPIPINFINKKLINSNFLSLNSLLDEHLFSERISKSTFFPNLKKCHNIYDKIVFLFRTIVPVKEWMNTTYNTHTHAEIVMAYFKYWLYLFNRHILKREVHYGS
jgi:hypothetical protein